MGASIYGNVGGSSRKAKELYAKVNGVSRKIKGEYAKVDGVVRKVYSGYDCKATVNTVDAGTHDSYINSNGRGKLHVWSSYYDSDPATYTAYIDFTFKEPLEYVSAPYTDDYPHIDYKNPPSNACVKFIGSWPDSDFGDDEHSYYNPLRDNDCYLKLMDLEKSTNYQWISKQTPGYTPHTYEIPKYGITCDKSGSSRHFRLRLSCDLDATENRDDEQYITWDKIIFLGKTLNSIELI